MAVHRSANYQMHRCIYISRLGAQRRCSCSAKHVLLLRIVMQIVARKEVTRHLHEPCRLNFHHLSQKIFGCLDQLIIAQKARWWHMLVQSGGRVNVHSCVLFDAAVSLTALLNTSCVHKVAGRYGFLDGRDIRWVRQGFRYKLYTRT